MSTKFANIALMSSHETSSGIHAGPNQIQLLPVLLPVEADFVLHRQSKISFNGNPLKILTDESIT